MNWEHRTYKNAHGPIKHRVCMACGSRENIKWVRYIGPEKTERWTSTRYRVVLCDACVEELSRMWQEEK